MDEIQNMFTNEFEPIEKKNTSDENKKKTSHVIKKKTTRRRKKAVKKVGKPRGRNGGRPRLDASAGPSFRKPCSFWVDNREHEILSMLLTVSRILPRDGFDRNRFLIKYSLPGNTQEVINALFTAAESIKKRDLPKINSALINSLITKQEIKKNSSDEIKENSKQEIKENTSDENKKNTSLEISKEELNDIQEVFDKFKH